MHARFGFAIVGNSRWAALEVASNATEVANSHVELSLTALRVEGVEAEGDVAQNQAVVEAAAVSAGK